VPDGVDPPAAGAAQELGRFARGLSGGKVAAVELGKDETTQARAGMWMPSDRVSVANTTLMKSPR